MVPIQIHHGGNFVKGKDMLDVFSILCIKRLLIAKTRCRPY